MPIFFALPLVETFLAAVAATIATRIASDVYDRLTGSDQKE